MPKKQSIHFHIHSDDYFATLATVLDLMNQESEKTMEEISVIYKKIKATHKVNMKCLKNLKKDLMFLQKNYKIVEKGL